MSLNSSNRFAVVSWRGLEPSRGVFRSAIAIHALAFAACLTATLSWPVVLMLTSLLAVSLGGFVRTWSALPGGLALTSGGQWRLVDGREEGDHRLLFPVFVTTWLVVARLRGPRRVRTLIIGADSLAPAAFRRLRVRLLQCANGRRDRT